MSKISANLNEDTEVWFGSSYNELPDLELAAFDCDIFASYSGPDTGLLVAHELEQAYYKNQEVTTGQGDVYSALQKPELIAGAPKWTVKNRKAYGLSMSLYEQHPFRKTVTGDPVADSFALCARSNNAVLLVADGVNWGEKSRLAARCAVYGCMQHINNELFSSSSHIKTVHDVFKVMLKSLDTAQSTILRHDAGLTTVCVAVVCPLKEHSRHIVCVVNVGDSLAFVFSKQHGIREVTTGSHDITLQRDLRDAGGGLGPVNGQNPELHNLTCSMTCSESGDVVYLTTDGISDNFDPVVTKIAVAVQKKSAAQESHVDASPCASHEDDPSSEYLRSIEARRDVVNSNDLANELVDGKPVMAAHERHRYAVKEMERIVHEYELFTESQCSAQELCGAIVQHVLKVTNPKRQILENPKLFRKKSRPEDREKRDQEIVEKLSKSPGKLDHATLVAYEIGCYRGNEEEKYSH